MYTLGRADMTGELRYWTWILKCLFKSVKTETILMAAVYSGAPDMDFLLSQRNRKRTMF